jgi:8-oxo-dGTP pyrophosphatase MutT (NUDIX family)
MKIPVIKRAFVLVRHPAHGWLVLRNGSWQLPGGHCEKKESLLMGAVRELREETGIIARPEQLVMVDVLDKRAVFLLSLPNQPISIQLSDEHTESHWVPTSDLQCIRWLGRKQIKRARRLDAQARSRYTA